MTAVAVNHAEQQRAKALRSLERANEIRLARAGLLRTIRTTPGFDLRPLVQDPPECIRSLTLFRLLCARRFWARKKATRLLRCVGCSEFQTVGGLSDRQRAAVCYELEKAFA